MRRQGRLSVRPFCLCRAGWLPAGDCFLRSKVNRTPPVPRRPRPGTFFVLWNGGAPRLLSPTHGQSFIFPINRRRFVFLSDTPPSGAGQKLTKTTFFCPGWFVQTTEKSRIWLQNRNKLFFSRPNGGIIHPQHKDVRSIALSLCAVLYFASRLLI